MDDEAAERREDEGPEGAGSAAAEAERQRLGTPSLLAAAAVLAALIGWRASLLGGQASSAWQQALRTEIKRGAAVVEDVRFVYQGEAPSALAVARATIRAEEYRAAGDALSGTDREALVVEAETQDSVGAVAGGDFELVTDPKYRTEDGGYDLELRLADVRAEHPDLVALDPDAGQAAGDALARKATLELSATIPVAAAFLLGALSQGFSRRRRPFLVAGFALLAAGLLLAAVIELTAA